MKRRRSLVYALFIAFLVVAVAAAAKLLGVWPSSSKAEFTSYPPMLYADRFSVCEAGSPCQQRRVIETSVSVEEIPRRCCGLTVTNGDGAGHQSVRAFDIWFNGEKLRFTKPVPWQAIAPVHIRQQNSLKVALEGPADGVVWVMLSYDPR